MPPSSDRFSKPAPKSLRGKSGRKQGKQPGTPGANLSLVENPDTIVDHAPSACSGCGAGLRRSHRAGVIRRQVVDLPPVRPSVTEHRLHRLRCRGYRRITTAAAPACYGPNVTVLAVYLLTYQHIPVSRTAQLLADLLGLPVSTGWVAGVPHPSSCQPQGVHRTGRAGIAGIAGSAGGALRRDRHPGRRKELVAARRLHAPADCLPAAPPAWW
jgi:hypothetical protein